MARYSNKIAAQTLGDRLRRERQARGLSVRKLASEAGVGKNTVVEVEQGRKPHRATLVALCNALGIKPSNLLNPEEGGGQRIALHRLDGATEVENALPGGLLAPSIMRVTGRSRTQTGTGETLVYVVSGSVNLYLSDSPYRLSAGDAASFWSAEPHSLEAVPEGSGTADVLLVSATKGSAKKKA
jgi:transcriptional regulator with XRE-family HTH domain